MTAGKGTSFADFILDQLAGLGGVTARSMFGGYGLYQGKRFFAILSRGRLFFRTGSATRASYQEHGMKQFQPNARQTLKNYFEVPADVIEDNEELAAWARAAVECCGTSLEDA
jgi:DNA transformation protein